MGANPSEIVQFKVSGLTGVLANFKKMNIFAVLAPMFVFHLLAVSIALAAPAFYVRTEATGRNDGSDWTNAYRAIPATLTRGATYYIADGSYGSYDFDDPVSGTSLITVNKATVSSHGTSTGWFDSYGDGQAVFSLWNITTSYWVIDGGRTDGYGFAILGVTAAGQAVNIRGDLSHITVKSLSIDCTDAPTTTRNVRVYCIPGRCTDLLFSNVETKYSGNDCYGIFQVDNSIFEYLYLHSKVLTTQHGDGFEIGGGDNVHIRYSKFNWNDQMIFWRGDFSSGSYHIYGNLFFDQPSVGKPIHSQSGNPVVGPLYIYNNTFVNVLYALQVYSQTTGFFKNNLIINTGGSNFGSIAHDFNSSDREIGEVGMEVVTSAIFKNYAGKDYSLASQTARGDSGIGADYKTDSLGRIRGADGVWDRGAFEYDSLVPLPPEVRAPVNLRLP